MHTMSCSWSLFELCNPHLVPAASLAQLLATRCPGIQNIHALTDIQVLELAVAHLAPKSQREYRDNRRGRLLKRLQRGRKRKAEEATFTVKSGGTDAATARASTAAGGDAAANGTDSPSKRKKITWP